MRKLVVAFILALTGSCIVPRGIAAAPARKVVIGHAALNARVAPLWVAEDHGFFIKYGRKRQFDFYSPSAGAGGRADRG